MQADGRPVKFDPNYATPVRGAELPAILVSSDDVGFYGDLKFLVDHSPPFHDMVFVVEGCGGKEVVDDGKPRVLTFLCSALALKFILEAMSYAVVNTSIVTPQENETRRPTVTLAHKSLPCLKKTDKTTIEEILDFSKMYELDDFVHLTLYDSMKKSGHFPPAVMLAVTAWTHHGNSNYWGTQLITAGGLQAMDEWSTKIIKYHAPDILEGLTTLFQRWEEGYSKFKESSVRVPIDGYDGFHKVCLVNRCKAFKDYKGNFQLLQTTTREMMWAYAFRSPMLMHPSKVAKYCMDTIGCDVCVERIAGAISWAWKHSTKKQTWTMNPRKRTPKRGGKSITKPKKKKANNGAAAAAATAAP